ncbi:MAG: glycosyltransferase [Cellvibrionaceae bacterium]
MKIFHTITSIDRRFGGPSYTVPRLCEELLKFNKHVVIQSLNPKTKTNILGCPAIFHNQVGPHILGFSPQMFHSLMQNTSNKDIIHSHGLWQMPSYYSFQVQKKRQCVHVISPRGMLQKDALSRSSIKKKIFGLCWQNSVLKNATCFHAASESEYQSIRNNGLQGPVTIIENGVDYPARIPKKSLKKSKKILFMSRIHPHKGIEILIDAWLTIYQSMPDWELTICGPGEEPYLSKIIDRIKYLSGKRVNYLPAKYDDDKTKLLLSSDVFVLPSLSENFGIVIAEALAHGIPVITTKGTPWEKINSIKCGWWIDRNIGAIASLLQQVNGMAEEDLIAMGKIGRQWVMDNFSWHQSAEKMNATYQWLQQNGEKPSYVHIV